MPPKAKFTKSDIICAALQIIREEGADALTARSLGARLGTSSCPVFTLFSGMEEVREASLVSARALYKKYVEIGLSRHPAFKGVGTQYILFAVNEPRLFQLLFMSEQKSAPDLSGILPLIEESYDQILFSIQSEYNVTPDIARSLYRHLWIYTHGIASLCATKMCRFTENEISSMMTEVFLSLLAKKREDQNP